MLVTPQRNSPGVEETRSRIIAAARALFEHKGTRGTTTREVAELAGVNEATLFRHFGSKRALLEAMREAACNADVLRSVLAALPGSDVREDLRAIARYAVDHMLGKRAMMCVSLAEDAAGTDDSPEWRGPAQLVREVGDYFAARVAVGAMRGDPLLLGRMFLGMLFSCVIGRKLWESNAPDEATLDALVDVFLNGVLA